MFIIYCIQVISVSGFSLNKSPIRNDNKPTGHSPTIFTSLPSFTRMPSSTNTSQNSMTSNYCNKDIYMQQQSSRMSSSFKESDGTISLLDGRYDEQESMQSFQEALIQWRNAGDKTGDLFTLN